MVTQTRPRHTERASQQCEVPISALNTMSSLIICWLACHMLTSHRFTVLYQHRYLTSVGILSEIPVDRLNSQTDFHWTLPGRLLTWRRGSRRRRRFSPSDRHHCPSQSSSWSPLCDWWPLEQTIHTIVTVEFIIEPTMVVFVRNDSHNNNTRIVTTTHNTTQQATFLRIFVHK